jgi:hypothetical protein
LTPSPVSPQAGSTVEPIVYPIYLVASKGIASQIWQVAPQQGNSAMLYELKDGNKPAGAIFPPEKLRMFLESQFLPITTTVNGILPQSYIAGLTLLEAEKKLVWTETDSYCFDERSQCLNATRLKRFDLVTGSIENLLELPDHGSSGYDTFGEPDWSPNGHYIAIARGSVASEAVSEVIMDTKTGQTWEIAHSSDRTDLFGPLVWSPDSAMVALYIWKEWSTNESGGVIRLFDLATQTPRDIQLDKKWIMNQSLSWKPDGTQVAFAAVYKNLALPGEIGAIGLHLLDPKTGSVQDVPINPKGAWENPRWAYNSQLLAADYRPKEGGFIQSLMIIEPKSGQIINQLKLERRESGWVWERDNHSILVVTGTDTRSEDRVIQLFDIRDDSLTPLNLPEGLEAKHIFQVIW